MRCPRVSCRATMTEVMDRLGRLSWTCPACARRRAGICQHCPRPVIGTIGRAHYCAACRTERKRKTSKIWRENNLERQRRSSRKYRRAHVQEHRAACQRWRERNREYQKIRMRAYRWSKKGELAPAKPLTRSECGKLGGKKGSAARIAALGPERVKEIAAKARAARWAKHRAAKAAQQAEATP